jgi:hypothetical protein
MPISVHIQVVTLASTGIFRVGNSITVVVYRVTGDWIPVTNFRGSRVDIAVIVITVSAN